MRRLSGFSLMEMMVVLMIVAIIAAVSAPMMSKKAIKTASDGSPWSWVQNDPNESIWYRGNNGIALIGTARRPSGLNSRLYIDNNSSAPHISLGSNGNNIFHLAVNGGSKSIAFSDAGLQPRANHSVAIGHGAAASNWRQVVMGTSAVSGFVDSVAIGADAHGDRECSTVIGSSAIAEEEAMATAIGYKASTKGHHAIAIGSQSAASANGAIVIGSRGSGSAATASATNSIAIGTGAVANQNNSVAIGAGVQTTAANEIRLGDTNSRVVIDGTLVPRNFEIGNLHVRGNLVVDGSTFLGARDGSQLYARESHWWDGVGDVKVFYDARHQFDGISDSSLRSSVLDLSHFFSDRRLKNVGKSFTAGLAEIKKLEVFNYTFKDDKSKTPRVGIMAQDLQKIFPNAVIKGDDGFLRIRMEDMFYALVNAVKELDNKIYSNSKRIEELEKQNAELLKRIEQLEKK